jgi:hypothetical protein
MRHVVLLGDSIFDLILDPPRAPARNVRPIALASDETFF